MTSRQMNPASLAKLKAFQHRIVETQGVPSTHCIVWRDGVVVHDECTGVRRGDGVANDKTTIYRFYSMTKPIVSVALMTLFDEGKFLLADPIWLYLGEAWKKENMRVFKSGSAKAGYTTEPCQHTITVKHILTHTSGLSYGFDFQGISNPVDAIYHKEGAFLNESRSLQEFSAKLATMPLRFQPGDAYLYGFNADICGALIEAISGQSLDVFLEERIFKPLGMVDTAFWVPPEKYHRFTSMWMHKSSAPQMGIQATAAGKNKFTATFQLRELDFRWRDDFPAIQSRHPQLDLVAEDRTRKPKFLGGGGGLCGTASDFARFCEMLMHGGRVPGNAGDARIISSHTLKFMTQNHLVKDGALVDFGGMALPGYSESTAQDGVGFGLGFSVVIDQALARQPDSVGAFSWGGAASTSFICDPRENMFVVFLTALRFRDDRLLPLRSMVLQNVYACIDDDPQAVRAEVLTSAISKL